MATRQYIGARYVPKFANPIEWAKEKSYEALTIETYLNNSYTSKKSVPANTEITDTNYWVITGNYNAQVEQYRQEVIAYRNESVKHYDTMTDVIADTDLVVNECVTTLGYYAINDGGAGVYLICDESKLHANETHSTVKIKLNNGLYAELVVSHCINVRQCGAYGDGIHNDTNAINSAIATKFPVYIPTGTYLITTMLTITGKAVIFGDGEEDSVIYADGCNGLLITGANNSISNLKISGNNLKAKSEYGIHIDSSEIGGNDSCNKITNVNVNWFTNCLQMENSVRGNNIVGCKFTWASNGVNCIGTDNYFELCVTAFCTNGFRIYNNNVLASSKSFQGSGNALSLTGANCMVSDFDIQQYVNGIYAVSDNNTVKNVTMSDMGNYYDIETKKTVINHNGSCLVLDSNGNNIQFTYGSTSEHYINTVILSNTSKASNNILVANTTAANVVDYVKHPNNTNFDYLNKITINNKNYPIFTTLGTLTDSSGVINVPYQCNNVVLRICYTMPNSSQYWTTMNVRLGSTYQLVDGFETSDTYKGNLVVSIADHNISIKQQTNVSLVQVITGFNN